MKLNIGDIVRYMVGEYAPEHGTLKNSWFEERRVGKIVKISGKRSLVEGRDETRVWVPTNTITRHGAEEDTMDKLGQIKYDKFMFKCAKALGQRSRK